MDAVKRTKRTCFLGFTRSTGNGTMTLYPQLLTTLGERVGRFVVRRPTVTLLVAVGLGIGSIPIASQIRFDSSFQALLPEDDPTVLEVERVKAKAGGTVDLIIALKSVGEVDEPSRMTFARKVVDRLATEPWVQRVDTEFPVDFFEDRRLLFLTETQLLDLDEAIADDIARTKSRAKNPLYVDLVGGDQPWANAQSVLDGAGDGYDDAIVKRVLRSEDNRYQYIRLKPGGTSYDMVSGDETLSKIDRIVQSLGPQDAHLEIQYSGALPVNLEQHHYMTRDMQRASTLAFVLIILLLTAFTRQAAAPLVLAFPLVLGVVITLAFTALTIGQLNIVSGFLISALLGIGIEYAIHLYLRFLEERDQHPTLQEAMWVAIKVSFPGCLTSALTTGGAFVVMVSSDFRAFREYGAIASTGVLVTLVTTYLTMPPLAILLSRKPRPAKQIMKTPAVLRAPFAWTMIFVGLAITVYAVPAGLKVPFYNDFKKELKGYSPATDFSAYVEKSMGGSLAPATIAVESLDDARKVEKLAQARVADPKSDFSLVFSLATLVPEDLDARRKALDRIQKQIDSVDEDQIAATYKKEFENYRRLSHAQPWTAQDVPKVFSRFFQSMDKSLLFVLVWPRKDMAIDKDIIAWAAELDQLQVKLDEAGVKASILDENRVAARVLQQIRTDGPTIVLYAALMVFLAVSLHFRKVRRIALVSGTLVLGFIWMFGAAHAFGLKVNVFNMAVLPTVVGIGIDNAVHLMHRYLQEGRGSVAKVVSTTGAAGILASATTAIGFGSTIIAHHNGIKSMGELALTGFATTLIASTVFFPCVLFVLERFGKGKTVPAADPEPHDSSPSSPGPISSEWPTKA
jgi:uncharacterized protein